MRSTARACRAAIESPPLAAAKMVAMCAFGIYSYYQVATQFYTNVQTGLDWSSELPDNCVPWMAIATKSFVQPTTALFSYQGGVSYVRLCTPMNSSATDAQLGAEYRYDPLMEATHGACNLTSQQGLATAAHQCTGLGGVNCTAALYTQPLYHGGASWVYGFTPSAGQRPGSCAVSVAKMPVSGAATTCTQPNVFAYSRSNNAVKAVTFAALAASLLLVVVELAGVISIACCKRPNGAWAVARAGALGPMYIAWRVLLRCQPRPQRPRPSVWAWLYLLFTDGLCDVAMPIMSVYGCAWATHKQLLLLAVWGVVKTSVMATVELVFLIRHHCMPHSSDDEAKCTSKVGPAVSDRHGDAAETATTADSVAAVTAAAVVAPVPASDSPLVAIIVLAPVPVVGTLAGGMSNPIRAPLSPSPSG